ncbi:MULTISPECIES: RluA family pseudouridine synthase [unclassified Aureimonas]|uniref:RluA family pseudouridine synthase n=1 Tax=unclassified Aureimonas TaxID=2615206 RepID=UPI0006F82D81|nr:MULTISPECIES: RluA family pseudouridine synthase [unclassified Aureimonas]KQT55368.1 RNA pseudouridine synthase [Aureimonas sp. Leaf427]KQT71159.1 RNA pseudouridine synthase [Aureimonas sp. Leaf460]
MSPAPTGDEEAESSRFAVESDEAGARLDQFLGAKLAGELSRSRIQALIAAGEVLVDGVAATATKQKVVAGSVIELFVPEPVDADPRPENIPLAVLYEDDALIVIDKPAGLVVHPGPGNWTGTLVNALLHHCVDSLSGIGGVKRPGIVHRLDKDTSGVMVVAKTDAAHRDLADQFAAHGRDGRMERAYRAIVWGVPERPAGVIDAPLGRSTTDRVKRQVVPATRSDAREAVTHYAVRARSSGEGAPSALVDCVLETGRTHQIRVHMAHIGHPLIGDEVYGAGFRTKARTLPPEAQSVIETFRRQALHAFRLGFEHPSTGEPMSFETPIPEDLQRLASALGIDAAN